MRTTSPTVMNNTLSSKQTRSLQSFVGGPLIRISEHSETTPRGARFKTCGAPFLACRNSILHDAHGTARCNGPFVHCKRYIFDGELRVGRASRPASGA